MDKAKMIFLEVSKGIGKKSEKPFTVLKLHDPDTLQNADFFLPEDHKLKLEGLKFKDQVLVEYGMQIQYGQPRTVVQSIIHA
jgi:hypothetical protein